jgi:outer membrane protein assembly factor BamB
VPRAAAKPGQAKPKILDPAAVAAQAQNLPLPNKLALPAVLAANANQERLEEEMRDEPEMGVVLPVQEGLERTTLLPDGDRFVQFSVKLLESKTIERQAMKAPPTKSALEGDVNASSTAAVANEILNEIQRDRGGDVISEDVSRYQITLRCPGVPDAAEWVGEVIGPSEVFPLKTVNVLAAGKSVWVFDKANKKLWESKLNFPISGGGGGLVSGETRLFGDGPVVERGDTLYLFDQGVLSAFDMANGNARWRLPAVGVSGLHFDDEGMIYVNTSSASPDILRYPNQIDISEKATQIILKINAKTGATVWKLNQEGLVSYVSGKYIYSTVTHAGDGAGEGILGVKTGLELPPHIRIKRLDPGSGRVLWDYYQERFPLDFHFEKNTIQLLFKKEMLVLQYFSL